MDTFADSLILARDHTGRAARAELERAVRRGHLVRVIEGVYVAAATWNSLDDVARHLVRAHAAQHIRQRRLVFSHWTAAAAWELPLVDAPPSRCTRSPSEQPGAAPTTISCATVSGSRR